MILPLAPSAPSIALPPSFEVWRSQVRRLGSAPVVAVAGSRGKSTVVHLLNAALNDAGLRTATWTDEGVVVLGRKQRGELVPWTRTLNRLASGEIDVAIQELDWATLHAVGLPRAAYPLVAITNLCINSSACLVQDETLRALQALRVVRAAVRRDGRLLINADDPALADRDHADQMLVAMSRDTPILRAHLQNGGCAAWVEDRALRIGCGDEVEDVLPIEEVAATEGGRFAFQVTNVLTVVGLGRALGLDTACLASTLRRHLIEPERSPGSFNRFVIRGATILVDRPAPPWFLRAPLRAVSNATGARLVRVIGRAAAIPDQELGEVGRLLGRGAGLIVIHSEGDAPERAQLILRGIAMNEVPPAVVHAKTETAALTALLKVVRPDDVVYVMADDPASVVRRLRRLVAQAPAI